MLFILISILFVFFISMLVVAVFAGFRWIGGRFEVGIRGIVRFWLLMFGGVGGIFIVGRFLIGIFGGFGIWLRFCVFVIIVIY